MKRRLRRILSLALLALLLVSAVPLPLSPAIAEGPFDIDNGVLMRYNGPGGNVRIPKGVTEIGEGVFANRADITSVTIPKDVTKIGNSAFKNCINLKKITIPRGITTIGFWAFYNCASLTRITIPRGITTIEVGAFGKCVRLTRVTIPRGVAAIEDGAFAICVRLARVDIPKGVTKIGFSAFEGCGLTRISIPDTVKTISPFAFRNCFRLARVDMGSGVETIDMHAFMGCTGLTDVELPNSVQEIGMMAFAYCTGLGSITIPESVEEIGPHAFAGCPNLRVATVSKGFDDDEDDMLEQAFPDGATEFLYLPDDLLPPAIFLKVGQTMALPKFQGAKVNWRTDDQSVATVGRGNRIKGLAEGDTDLKLDVQAAAKGKALTLNGRPLKPGETYTIKLKVFGKKDPTARKVTVVQPKKPVLHPLGIGYPKTEKIELAFTPAALNADDDWKGNCFYISSNPKVAQVRADGTIIAVKPDKARITVYAPNMKTAKVTVTVKGLITDIKLKEDDEYVKKLTLGEGERIVLKPEFNEDAAYTALRWSSSKPAVAYVDGFGEVNTLSAGTAKITATAMDGSRKKATVIITVLPPK
ncbi:MAG: leucine-rich repeat protein [Christensenellales bacterium]|jgi:hypothetical protein